MVSSNDHHHHQLPSSHTHAQTPSASRRRACLRRLFFWTRDLLLLDQLGDSGTGQWRLQVQMTALNIFRECADTEMEHADDADVDAVAEADADIFRPGDFIAQILQANRIHAHLYMSLLKVAERFGWSPNKRSSRYTWLHPNPFTNVCRYVLSPPMTAVLFDPDANTNNLCNNNTNTSSVPNALPLRQDFLGLHSQTNFIPEDFASHRDNRNQPSSSAAPKVALPNGDQIRVTTARGTGRPVTNQRVGTSLRSDLALAREFLSDARVPCAIPVTNTNVKLQHTLIQRWTDGEQFSE